VFDYFLGLLNLIIYLFWFFIFEKLCSRLLIFMSDGLILLLQLMYKNGLFK